MSCFYLFIKQQQQPFYGHLVQDNPAELMLLQRKVLLEQTLDFYELDVLPATQPIVSKHYRKTHPPNN